MERNESNGKELVGASKELVVEPKLKDLFSEWTIRGIKSWNDVHLLGRNNIQELISRLRGNEKETSERIRQLRGKQELLRGKSGEWFIEEAKKYENPSFPQIGIGEGWSREPEPMDADSINRKSEATTFNVCGWCKHRGGGTCRYSYLISGSCSLLYETSGGKFTNDVKFNTPCLFHSMTAQEIEWIVQCCENTVNSEKQKREQIRTGIRKTQHLKEGTTKKPFLISLRPYNLFNIADPLMVYLGGYQNLIVDAEWAPAKAIFGYRHHDGCVSYCTEFPVSNGEYLNGCGGGAGMSRPEVLLLEEFNYLRKATTEDKRFLEIWLANVKGELKDFNSELFAKHLVEGRIAEATEQAKACSDVPEVKTVEDALSVLCLLMEPKTREEVQQAVRRMVKMVHPDKLNGMGEEQKSYGERMTKAVYAARDLLLQRLG